MIFYIVLALLLIALGITFAVVKSQDHKRKTQEKTTIQERQSLIETHRSIPKHIIWNKDQPISSNDLIEKTEYKGWTFEPYKNRVQYVGEDIEEAQENSLFGWDFVETTHGFIVSAKDHDNCGAIHFISKGTKEIKQTIIGLETGAQFGYKLLWEDNVLYVSAPMQKISGTFGRGCIFTFTFGGSSWKEGNKFVCQTDHESYGYGIGLSKGLHVAFYDKHNQVCQERVGLS